MTAASDGKTGEKVATGVLPPKINRYSKVDEIEEKYFPEFTEFSDFTPGPGTMHNGSNALIGDITEQAFCYIDEDPEVSINVKNMPEGYKIFPTGIERCQIDIDSDFYEFGDFEELGWAFFKSINARLFDNRTQIRLGAKAPVNPETSFSLGQDYEESGGLEGIEGVEIEVNEMGRPTENGSYSLSEDEINEYISEVAYIIQRRKNEFYPLRAEDLQERIDPRDERDIYYTSHPEEVVDMAFENAGIEFRTVRRLNNLLERILG